MEMISWKSDNYGTALKGLLAVSIQSLFSNFKPCFDIMFFGNWPSQTSLAPNYFHGTLEDARAQAEIILKGIIESENN